MKTQTVRVTTKTDLTRLHASLRRDGRDVEFVFSSDAASRRLTEWLARREGLSPSTVAV